MDTVTKNSPDDLVYFYILENTFYLFFLSINIYRSFIALIVNGIQMLT